MRTLRDPKRKPTHPGAVLRATCCLPRLTVSDLLLEKRGLSPEIAARIGRLLDTTPESWLRMHEALDLCKMRPEKPAAVQPINAAG